MSQPSKFDLKRTRFTITKSSTMGHYSLKAHNCSYLNYANGTASDIAKWLSGHIAHTLRSMSINNASEINIIMSWKEDQPNQ